MTDVSRWIVRVIVSLVLAAILLSVIPAGSLVAAISRVRIWTWSASLAVFFAGHFLNALKLRLLLGAPAVPVSTCVQAQYAGLVANLGLPGIAGGDVVRAGYLLPSAGVARVGVASVADRVIDTGVLLALIAVALPIAGMPPALAELVWISGWWMGGGFLAVAGLGLLAWRFWPRTGAVRRVSSLVSELASRRTAVVTAMAISVGVQSAFVLTNLWLAREVGVTTAVSTWFVAWPLSKLVAVLPISLGGLGVREAVLVSTLTPYGAPGDAVFAAGILWQSVLAVSGLIGLIGSQALRTSGSLPASTHPAREA